MVPHSASTPHHGGLGGRVWVRLPRYDRRVWLKWVALTAGVRPVNSGHLMARRISWVAPFLALAVGLVVVVAACGSGTTSESAPTARSQPVPRLKWRRRP